MKTSLPWGGILPAFGMAVLVLFVFSTLQYYGPDSAVWRFHEAVANNDREDLLQVIYRPVPEAAVNQLAFEVAHYIPPGARMQVRDYDRQPGYVEVSVTYRIPNSVPVSAIFATRYTNDGWKVDVVRTLNPPWVRRLGVP